MQHSQNSDRAQIVGFHAINDQIGQLGKLLDRRQYAATDRRGSNRVVSGDPFNNPKKIIVRRLGPSNRHGRGETIRSKAAATI